MSDLDQELLAAGQRRAMFSRAHSNPKDADNLNKIFRLAHNLKVRSKAVGFDEVGVLTHDSRHSF